MDTTEVKTVVLEFKPSVAMGANNAYICAKLAERGVFPQEIVSIDVRETPKSNGMLDVIVQYHD